MKTTLEIPDELYRQAKVKAAAENRKMKDLVSEGLSLVLGLTGKRTSKPSTRREDPAVNIHPENKLPALVKLEPDLEERRDEAARLSALAAMEEIRQNPPYPPGRVQEMIDEANRLRKEGWNRSDLDG